MDPVSQAIRLFGLSTFLASCLSCVSVSPPEGASSEKLLLQVVTKEEDPHRSGLPGEQSLVHRLYLVDLAQRRVLAQVQLGVGAMVFYCPERPAVWVAQQCGKDEAHTRIREFRLPDLTALADLEYPLRLAVPTDPNGRFRSNSGMVVLNREQVVLTAQFEDSLGFEVVKIDASRGGQGNAEPLGAGRTDFSDFLRLGDRRSILLCGNGDGVFLEGDGTHLVAKRDLGICPWLTDSAQRPETLDCSVFCPGNQSLVAITDYGRLLRRRLSEEHNTGLLTTATRPEEISADPSGRVAAIRTEPDPNTSRSQLVVVDLEQHKECARFTLPSDGAILVADSSRILFGDGSTLKVMSGLASGPPSVEEVFRLQETPVERIIRIIPEGPRGPR